MYAREQKPPISGWEVAKSVFGFFLSPLTAFVELIMGLVARGWYGKVGYASPTLNRIDPMGASLPGITIGSRIGAILAATFFLVGFVGALAIPLPGLSPAYVGLMMLLKTIFVKAGVGGLIALPKAGGAAVGISGLCTWTMAGRGLGAAAGNLVDRINQHKMAKFSRMHQAEKVQSKFLKAALLFGFFGSFGVGFRQIVMRMQWKKKTEVKPAKFKSSDTKVTRDLAVDHHAHHPKLSARKSPGVVKAEDVVIDEGSEPVSPRNDAVDKRGSSSAAFNSLASSKSTNDLHDHDDEGEGEGESPHEPPPSRRSSLS